MARTLNGSGRGRKKQADETEETDGSPGAGHNLVLKPKEVNAFFKRLSKLATDFEDARGAYMADCKEIYEEAADKLGVPRSVVRKAFNERRAEEKRRAAEMEMEPSERESLGAIRDALGPLADLPLGRAAMGESQDSASA